MIEIQLGYGNFLVGAIQQRDKITKEVIRAGLSFAYEGKNRKVGEIISEEEVSEEFLRIWIDNKESLKVIKIIIKLIGKDLK